MELAVRATQKALVIGIGLLMPVTVHSTRIRPSPSLGAVDVICRSSAMAFVFPAPLTHATLDVSSFAYLPVPGHATSRPQPQPRVVPKPPHGSSRAILCIAVSSAKSEPDRCFVARLAGAFLSPKDCFVFGSEFRKRVGM
ncbi:uncharacterized protein LOC123430279 [Hordeum vulgare subsp. vulgare]|uniref:uncharacterized protein LOC123430279 n=1 Tax=Hordeum vulgare subsp. vulgare TaxID=112509 RepID=UPI001D1A5303|nr:uncharacterized protein LOC123430279 [Hordeum vulgare subsp. vulgare]